MELARKNAFNAFAVSRTREEQMEGLLLSLKHQLGLPVTPRRIECFDVSTFQGALTVGSLVYFEEGKPLKDRYRKYRIRTVSGTDDFASLREVLSRRIAKGLEAQDLPDLIMVDGGKGQLSGATSLLREMGAAERVSVIALAKERRSRGTTERVFAPGRSDPLPLAQDSPESLYLQRIRDEAHRFAIRYHRELRKKATLRTGLEEIPGVGKARRDAIIARFGTLRKIREATEAEIAEVVGPRLARAVYQKLIEAEPAAGPMPPPADAPQTPGMPDTNPDGGEA